MTKEWRFIKAGDTWELWKGGQKCGIVVWEPSLAELNKGLISRFEAQYLESVFRCRCLDSTSELPGDFIIEEGVVEAYAKIFEEEWHRQQDLIEQLRQGLEIGV